MNRFLVLIAATAVAGVAVSSACLAALSSTARPPMVEAQWEAPRGLGQFAGVIVLASAGITP